MSYKSKGELIKKIRKMVNGEKSAVSADRLAAVLRLKKGERPRFVLTLAEMEREGILVRDKKGRYSSPATALVRARMMSLQRGYGFARPENGGADIFIPGRDLGDALPGDTVLVQLEPGDSRGPQGRVQQIAEKGGRLFTGRFSETDRSEPEVVPDSLIRYSLPVRRSKELAVKSGDKVRFEVSYNRSGDLIANVVTVYGSADSARVCADAIVDAAGIPTDFPDQVHEQAKALASAGISAEELANRLDLREQTVFTIDGRDAKDLDDAVSLDVLEDGWRLGVHIADVSHYVRENTPLDAEARGRGTSVYFADRVIPMLPEELSNGVCSLNAGEDKLTLSAIMTLDQSGACKKLDVRKSVIRSCVRGVYSEVNQLFDGSADEAVQNKYAKVRPMLDAMRKLTAILHKAAVERGTMDLISTEPVFTLDEQGHPVDIRSRSTGESEGMIEQFMIAANVAVAVHARKQGVPFVYRIHEQPNSEKLLVLSEMAQVLGFKTVQLEAPQDMRRLMEEAHETPYARLISDRLLRSMAKARYSENPVGHYGLSLSDYCHFTSPIRRYPDLSIHRILTALLGGMQKEEIKRRYTVFAHDSSELSSQYELRAMSAERDCEACYKAEYMGRFIGEEFDGVVSSVSPFGLFVELPNSVEGLVRLESLPEQGLRYNEIASFIDRSGRPLYTVGDAIKICVAATDVSTGQIDFEPA